MYVPERPLSVVATSKKNACVSLVFSFLYKVVQVSTTFLKVTSIFFSIQPKSDLNRSA